MGRQERFLGLPPTPAAGGRQEAEATAGVRMAALPLCRSWERRDSRIPFVLFGNPFS